jgi:FAD/FMN-containing dehydrogenase/Fe-S oxidoreductase
VTTARDTPHALLERALRRVVQGEVRFDRASRALYSTDASIYQIMPAGVVVPRTCDDVVATVRMAAEAGVSITARGGGTSQAGQAIGAGLILDTSKYLNRVLEVNVEERWAHVEPGVVLDDLNARLQPHGLRFAPDLSSSSRATLGGMMANNSSGARSIVHGKTIDHVLEQWVVLADGRTAHLRPLSGQALEEARRGETIEARAYRALPRIASEHAAEIERRFPKVLRRVGGYNLDAFVDPARPVDLTRIMVGSEGTLGVVVGARVRLVPIAAARVMLAVEFRHVLDALEATPVALRHGPSAVEVMDGFILGHARHVPALDVVRRRVVSDPAASLLCIELEGEDEAALAARLAALEREIRSRFRCRTVPVPRVDDQQRIWRLREAALGLATAMKGDDKSISFVEDTAVAPERLRDYIARLLAIVERHGTSAGVYAHASVGCLHVRPVVNLKTAEGVRRFEAIAQEVADLVLEFGGALSGEHGDGLVRGPFTEKMFGPELYAAFREVKRTFDPDGLFNPGKIVDSPPLTANLRYGPAYVTPDPPTWFDYAEHGGFGRAVEMCSGVGACRKTRGGTMCPSYRATREEMHSTRGRANLLRLALTGQLGDTPACDRDLYEALDLCLECRACRSECPTGVDMARMKSEFLAGYWARHGVSLRARLFGHVHEAAVWGQRLAPLSNALARSRAARRLGAVVAGLDPRRRLPRWASRTLTAQLRRRRLVSPSRAVVLFRDTFTEYMEPEIGIAAVDLLEAAGIGVRLAPHACCGRPLLSQGLLRQARARASTNAERLHAMAAEGVAILFLEPSCLSAVREDAPSLLGGELREKAEAVARASMLFEEFVEREWAAGRLDLPLAPGPDTVLLHAHCHQRAMSLAGPALALLSRVPGARVTDLDAGCCGMAGSFGYLREHYELSRAIGELALFPAARALRAGGVLVASGTSCRHQLEHFTGVGPMHPAVLLRTLLRRTETASGVPAPLEPAALPRPELEAHR